MNTPRKLKRTLKRTFSAHHILINAARRAFEASAEQPHRWHYDALAAMTFSALAIEALCNSIGKRVVPDWKDFENSSPLAKLRLLASKLDVEYEKNGEPWATARWLVKFRNSIAHAKPEFVFEKKILTQEEYDKRRFDIPKSKLERNITIANAKRSLEAVEELKSILCKKISPEDAWSLFVDGCSGSTEEA